MADHLFYFFSAVPQVLGAVLALFGVFIVFKIQTLKQQLFGLGESTLDEIKPYTIDEWRKLSNWEPADIRGIKKRLAKSIHRNELKELSTIISILKDGGIAVLSWRKFNDLYDFEKKLIRRTIFLSSFNAFTIIISLFTIPHIPQIILSTWKTNAFVYGVGSCTVVCFVGLIYILFVALREDGYSLFPN